MELVEILRKSGLTEGEAAIEAILSGAPVNVHDGACNNSELLGTYRIRLKSLQKQSSVHAHRLAAATEEFIDKLEQYSSERGSFTNIDCANGFSFLVYIRENVEEAILCARVVGREKLSEQEWEELWGHDV